MPITDLQQAAQKIAGFLATLNKLGGLRLKYRISAGDGAEAPVLSVELAGPDVALVTQHNGELLLALETISAQILRLDQREGDLISFDAANFKALRAQEQRLIAETAAEKGPAHRHSLRLPADEQPRAPPDAHGIPRDRRR
jgi:spoIIIJ-associated protein